MSRSEIVTESLPTKRASEVSGPAHEKPVNTFARPTTSSMR